MGVDFVGTVFTFVAAVALDATAPDLVAARAAAFNGFSAMGFLAADTAGFFELGIQPRYNKNEQAKSQAPTGRRGREHKQWGEEEVSPQALFKKARCRANIWCAVLAVY
jgi:hypothetical protein